MDFDIYLFNLYLEDESIYLQRLDREGKALPDYAKFNFESSVKQQRVYLDMAEKVVDSYPKIHVYNIETGKDIKKTKEELRKILDF